MGEALITRRGGAGEKWTLVLTKDAGESGYITLPDSGKYMAMLFHPSSITYSTIYCVEVENYTILTRTKITTGSAPVTVTSNNWTQNTSYPTRLYFTGHTSGGAVVLFSCP